MSIASGYGLLRLSHVLHIHTFLFVLADNLEFLISDFDIRNILDM